MFDCCLFLIEYGTSHRLGKIGDGIRICKLLIFEFKVLFVCFVIDKLFNGDDRGEN